MAKCGIVSEIILCLVLVTIEMRFINGEIKVGMNNTFLKKTGLTLRGK